MNTILRRICLLLSLLAVSMMGSKAMAQAWTLEQCLKYAEEHNLNIIQQKLQVESRESQLTTDKLAALPAVNVSADQQFSFGRATGLDNIIVNRSQANTSFGASANLPIFTGLRMTNQVKADKFNLQAALADLEKTKEDLQLNVTAYYLQALYAKAIVSIAEEQVALAEEQVATTRKMVENGKKAESELYDNLAALSADRQQLTESRSQEKLALLDLAQLLMIEDVASFDIAALDVNADLLGQMTLMQNPDSAYAHSVAVRPEIVAQQYRVESSKANVRVAQSGWYPTLSFSTWYGTGYYHLYDADNTPFGNQLKNNGSTVVGLSLNIPVFDRLQTRNNVRQAKVSAAAQALELERSRQSLLKTIQTAYYNALAAHDKLESARATQEASAVAFSYAQKHYDSGKASAYDLQQAKTRLQKAQVEATQALFEFVLRHKIFCFYAGEEAAL